MMLDAKINISEDTFTKYLDNLQENYKEQTPNLLKKMAVTATGEMGDMSAPIPKQIMPKKPHNPYLYLSGQDQSKWVFNKSETNPSLTFTYSGLGLPAEGKVWVEFSKEFIDLFNKTGDSYSAFLEIKSEYAPEDLTLDRDYALFQEIGVDEFAAPDAGSKHFVRDGLKEAVETGVMRKGLGDGLMELFKQIK